MNRKLQKRERFEQMNRALEPFRMAKRETIHIVAGIGRKHKILRYPILVCLTVFIFVYNLFLYAFLGLRVQEKFAKALAVAMSVILVFTSIDLTALAMTQKEKGFYKLAEIEAYENVISVPYKTGKEDLDLPEYITVTLDFYHYGEEKQETVETEEVPFETASEMKETEEELLEAAFESVELPVVQAEAPEEGVEEELVKTETPVESEPIEAPEVPEVMEITEAPEAPEVTEPTEVPEVPEVIEPTEVIVDSKVIDTTQVLEGTQTTEVTEAAKEQYVNSISAELPVTWVCDDYDSKTPGEYLFTARLPKSYDGYELQLAEEQILTIIVKVMEPKTLCLSETVDDIEISLNAAPGVFPEDASLSVTKIEDEASIEKIQNAIQNTLDEASTEEENTAVVEKTITFDIKVMDKDGKELQPEIPEGMSAEEAVTVTFKQVVPQLFVELSEEDADAEQTMEVYYIDDAMETAEQMNTSIEGEDLSINPEHFSLYSCTCRVSNCKLVTSWTSLYKAVYSKSGTINLKLGNDIKISKRSFYSNSDRLYLKNGQTVNLDLNGYDIYGCSNGKPAIEVKSGTINIHDTGDSGTISSPDSNYVIYANGGNATVNLIGGTIRKNGSEFYGIFVTNNAKVNMKGGSVTGSFYYGIYFNSAYCESGTISSGCIDGANYGVYIGGSTYRGSSFSMSGGSILNSKSAGIYNNSGAVTMSGGTISGNSGYKAYGIRNAGVGRLTIGGAVNFRTNRAADIYVGSSSTNYINVNSTLTGSRIGIETATAPTKTVPVQFTSNAVSGEKFYSAANSSYAVWQPLSANYYVVGPKENCAITVKPENVKLSAATEAIAGTVAIGTGAGSTTEINTTVKYNALVTLKATLTNAEEYEFTGWKDRDGNTVCTTLVYTFTATNDNTYTAVFTKKKYSISVGTSNSNRGGAAITASSPSASDGKYEVGSQVTIKASPKSDYQFAQWNDGDTSATRVVTVTGDAVYTAQFKKPDPSATATGELFVGVTKLTSNPSAGTKLLIIGGGEGMTESSGMIAVAGLPDDAARVTAVENGTVSNPSWSGTSIVVGITNSSGKEVKIDKKSDGSLYKGAAFDTCPDGKIQYYNGSWYYWCSGGACVGIGPYNVYSYTQYTTFKAGDIKASLNDLKLSPNQSTIQEANLTITVGQYTLKNLIFEDKNIDYSNGDRRIELNLGGVLFTYTLPEAIVVKPNGTRTEYDSMRAAIEAADTASGDKIYMVGSAISEITGSNTELKQGVTIIANDGSKIEADDNSKINASPDGTVELLKGKITATPATDGSNVSVDVDDATVTANKPITVTAGDDVTKATVTTTVPTSAITISPDGDPNHSVTYVTCPGEKKYGIHSGELTSEDKVIISDGTEYDLKVSLDENQETTIETSSTNPGKTIISKGEGGIVIDSEKPNNDIKVGDTTFTTNDDTTKLVIKPSESGDTEGGTAQKPEVELKEGSVQVPKDGTITLPNGKKVTNTTPSGKESVTAVADGNKVTVPDGAEATIGEGEDAIKISVPNGTPANLPAEITLKKDGSGLEVKAEPGNQVKIGNEEYTIGDYDTTFEITPTEDGNPKVVVSDGGVELKPGQSVTDSNGVTYTNNGEESIKLSMTEGENTEVSLGGGSSFTYQEKGKDPVSYTNPGNTEADFRVSKDGISLNSDMSIPKGKEVAVDFLGNDVKVKVPDTNQGDVKIDPIEGTITVEKENDKVVIDGKEYTASKDNTVLMPTEGGVELKAGGVKLAPSEDVRVNGTDVKNSGKNPCEVSVGEDGKTNVKVPQNGGFTMTDPDSGAGISFTNPNAEETNYVLDTTGSLVLPENSNITFKQGGTQTTIGSGANGVAICPSENGVEITVPEGGSAKVNDVTFANAGGTGEELVIAIDPSGKPVLESGKTSISENQKLGLAGGDTITSKKGDVKLDAEGNMELSLGDKVEIDRNGKKSSYTAETESTKLSYDPETGIPTLTEGTVKLDKNSAIDVIFNTIVHGEESELFDEEEKATITSKGTEAPTVASDGTITVPQNGAVDIDSEVTVGTGTDTTKKQAHNSIGVPTGAPNESVSVKPKTDGSADVTLTNVGDKAVINGMEYTTTEDNTIINMTETGSTLKKGAVALDGGKTPKEGINVNGTCVTNSGVAGTTVSVKAKTDGTTDFEVSAKGQFDLSVPGVLNSAVTFKNPGTDKATYTVETDGSIKLGADSAISFKAGVKEIEVAGGEGVSMKVTETGVAVSVESGKSVTIGGVTYKAPADTPFTLTIDHNGKPVITSGSVIVQKGYGVSIPKQDGSLLEVKKTADDPEKGLTDTITVTSDGKVLAYPGDTLRIGDGTYTCLDNSGAFNLSVNADSGEVTVAKGARMELTNGNLTFLETPSGGVTISTTGSKSIIVEKQASDAKPKVTVPAGGNVTIGDKTSGKEGEIKVPVNATENKQITIDESTGNLTVSLKAGEQITIGGIVYTAEQNGALTVNGVTGKLVADTTTPEGSSNVPSIDPTSFNKENYQYDLAAGETIKVGDVTYKAPAGGMILRGNEKGNPIIQIPNANTEVQIGEQTYKIGNANTKFVVNQANNVTLVDNGNSGANSSMIVEGAKNMTIDGNVITSSGTEEAGYVITKSAGGDVLEIRDGTKLSMVLGTESNGVVVKEPVTLNGQTTTLESTKITPTVAGSSIVLDKTSKDEEENYITKISANGYTVLTPVKDEAGKLIGFSTSIYIPQPIQPDEPDEDVIIEEEPVQTGKPNNKKPTTKEEKKEEIQEEKQEEKQEETGSSEEEAKEVTVVEIDVVEEANGVTVSGDVKVQLNQGEIIVSANSEDGKMVGDLQNILQACFAPEEIEQVQNGSKAEVRIFITRVTDDIEEEEKEVIQQKIQDYEKSLEGLQFGNYVEIVIESRVGESEWKQIHELNEEIEIMLTIPTELLKDNRTYFVVRNHEGTCTIMRDLDEDAETITIKTGQFSTYAILYTDENVADVDITELNQSGGVNPWVIAVVCMFILLSIFVLLFVKRHKFVS